MRITGGTHRGRRIIVPAELRRTVRPTTDFARQGLFNILANRIDFTKTKALDLFAGTGVIGFELLSRGCPEVTAIDSHEPCLRLIRLTAQSMGVQNMETIRRDVFSFLRSCENVYDLVFADPPFDMKNTEELLPAITRGALLSAGGWFILEHPPHRHFREEFFFEYRRYGNVCFTFFKK